MLTSPADPMPERAKTMAKTTNVTFVNIIIFLLMIAHPFFIYP
jgi:hypothetical protein